MKGPRCFTIPRLESIGSDRPQDRAKGRPWQNAMHGASLPLDGCFLGLFDTVCAGLPRVRWALHEIRVAGRPICLVDGIGRRSGKAIMICGDVCS